MYKLPELIKMEYCQFDVSDSENDVFQDLAPRDNIDEDGTYGNAICWALKNKNINNIAITGTYGSGKSSIIKTFEKNYTNKYIKISLASFVSCDEKTLDNEIIERSILQQLFYQVDDSKIPYSRFKKLKTIPIRSLLWRSILVIMWLFIGVVLLYPNILDLIENNRVKLEKHQWIYNKVPFIIILFSIISIWGLVAISRYIKANLKLSKINVNKTELSVDNQSEKSIFSKYIDEILYFFQVTKSDVVFIEDLDRFNNVEIFTKLRELNSLINNSAQISQRVVFIYAIKDDLFENKNRTKFFDFIIPVIPVINSSNSAEVLWQKIVNEKLETKISKEFVNDITIYIDDMRVLTNIFNEFIIYKAKLEEMAPNLEKLLSIIVYKNVYPNDFAALQFNGGIVCKAFQTKKQLITEKTIELENKCLQLEKEIGLIEREHLNSAKELRQIFLSLISSGKEIISIDVNGNIYSHDSFINNFNFYQFKKTDYIRTQLSGGGYKNCRGEEIENLSENTQSFYERQELIKLRNDNEIEKLKEELNSLSSKILEIKSYTLVQIIEEIGIEKVFTDEGRDKKLIIFILRNGHIDEQYQTYITYFYPGSLTQDDMKFIISVKDQEQLVPEYKLTNLSKVLERLNRADFKREYVLNYDLFNYILENKNNYFEYFELLMYQLSKGTENTFAFINGYLDICNNCKTFISELCHYWKGFWNYITSEGKLSLSKKDKYLKAILIFADIDDVIELNIENNLENYISNKQDFVDLIDTQESLQEIINILAKLNVKFKKINDNFKNDELFNLLIENNLYEINSCMICLILQKKTSLSPDEFCSKNYTSIKENLSQVFDYINANINEYIVNVFMDLETNDSESEESVIELLNLRYISSEIKNTILSKEKVIFRDITSVPSYLWDEIIRENKINVNWTNLIHYFILSKVINIETIMFLSNQSNLDILSKYKLDEGNSFDSVIYEDLATAIIQCEEIKNNDFLRLANCLPFSYNDYDISNLSETRIQSLFISNLFTLSPNIYRQLKVKDYHIKILEKYIQVYLENPTEYMLDVEDFCFILSSSTITLQQKSMILSNVDINLLLNNTKLLNTIADIILECDRKFDIPKDILVQCLNSNIQETKRLELLIKYMSNLGENDITNSLIKFGKEYKEITIKGKRPILSNTEENVQLLEALEKNRYISSIQLEKNYIRVNTKKK